MGAKDMTIEGTYARESMTQSTIDVRRHIHKGRWVLKTRRYKAHIRGKVFVECVARKTQEKKKRDAA